MKWDILLQEQMELGPRYKRGLCLLVGLGMPSRTPMVKIN